METFLYCDLTFKSDCCGKEEDKMWSNAGINHQINLQCGEKGPKLQLLFFIFSFLLNALFVPFVPSFFRKPNDLWFFSKFRAAAAATAAAAGEENGTDDPTPLFSF